MLGTISGWNPNVPAANSTAAQTAATVSGAAYTGLAIGNNGAANFLYAANFRAGKIDVFDKNFALTTLAGSFTDPGLPAGFAPFNIQSLGGKLYVAYAKVDPATGRDAKGPGNGFVDTFDLNGNFLQRLVSNGVLNSPWGLALSPASFGTFSNALLVGNFGDGRISAFDPATGNLLGQLGDESGAPIVIDELWALTFGNGKAGGDSNTLFFAAGIDEEKHGLFGSLQAVTPSTTLVQFSSSTYFVAEDAGSVNITVTRTGDTTGTSTVNFATFGGTSSERSHHIIATGTLTFAPGETSKSFKVLIIDEDQVEGDHTVNLALSTPTGAGLGSPSTATLTIADNDESTRPPASPKLFVASLSGAQEVPSTTSTATGFATLLLSADETTATVRLHFSGLTSSQVAAHIHTPAPRGKNAPVVFPFPLGQLDNFQITLTPAQVQDLKNGLFYVNVHTSNNPGGEIRGQFGARRPIRTFVASLNGAKEVPATTSTATGFAILQLSDDETSAKISLRFSGLTSDQIAAHIHGPAKRGVNAPVLFPFPLGQLKEFQINPTPAQVQDLKNGLYYVNVHTKNFPGGEIRGQLESHPIDDVTFFVRQHYLDFLNREPDDAGLAFWVGQITACGTDPVCVKNRRAAVSAAFFINNEFEQTAFFIYRVRKASLGQQPTFGQFVVDRNQINTGSDTDKTAFTEAFVQRPEFLAKYPATQSGSDFIDALLATVKQSSGVDLSGRRGDLVNEYIQGVTQAQSRARVIRKLVEFPEYTQAEFNPAFVLAQYFEYLRRDPDPGGLAFWLNVLNNRDPNNFIGMVCSFITSSEYQQRFSPNDTHNNADCGQQ